MVIEIAEKPTEQAPKITPIKGFQLYSLQAADMDLYSEPVMGIGLYKMTTCTSPRMIVYKTFTQVCTLLALVYKELKRLMFMLCSVCLLT